MVASYLDLVRPLPRPTDAQRDAFAHAMGQRHSWYKHLPYDPAVAFRFLIAPNAPQSSEPGNRLLDRRYAYVATAADHLEHFGHWCCDAPYAGGGGFVDEIRDRMANHYTCAVPDPGGGPPVPVPGEVLDAGLAWVNALIDPRAARFGPAISAELATAERLRMLGEMRAAMDRVATLIWG